MAVPASLRARVALPDAVAVALAVVAVVLFALTEDNDSAEVPRALDGTAALLLAAAVALLGLRRRWPGAVALAVLGLNATWHLAGYTNGLINAPTLVAFYALGATGDRRRQVAVGAGAVGCLLGGIVVLGGAPVSDALDAVGWTVAAILFGEVVRARRRLLDDYAERAARAEAEREAEAERRVAAERLRVARELHDVLAHTVSAMTVQAGVAADALERRPEAAAAALRALRSAGREAMDEVRATVAVLRDGSAVPTAPAPGLGRVGELVDAARAAGLGAEVAAEGASRPLPALVELTAYRVVQEALTNVVRHAGATRARVVLRYESDVLAVEVRDDGRGAPATPSPGFGLRGMAERVESLGGALSCGPAPGGGGFVVRATLPTPPAPAPG